ncbi:sulfotransferase domain-containing protein [soil metagenome]
MIRWVASYPRSGNALFRTSLTRFCGLRSATVYNEKGDAALPLPRVDNRPIELLRDLKSAVAVKTHDLEHANEPAPAVYIVRDGRDVVVSYAHFLRRMDRVNPELGLEETMEMVIEGKLGFGSWSKHVAVWTSRRAPTYMVRFEELVADPATVVREAAREMGMLVPPLNGSSRPPDFERERAKRPKLIRRGVVGSWRSEMPAELEQRFWQLHGDRMLALGYERLTT